METARKILKAHGLHVTTARLLILEIFLQTQNILDFNELMYLSKNVNRITLYRTLHLLYQHHLVLKVPSNTGITKYLYRGFPESARRRNSSRNPERKIHLICQDCGKIISVTDVSLPPISLPKNFEASFIDLIVNGKCKECSQ
ncbi:MAG TPA: transcriptional repressor [Puia sp.]|nr:transcriptional repressor [Puia sp.]